MNLMYTKKSWLLDFFRRRCLLDKTTNLHGPTSRGKYNSYQNDWVSFVSNLLHWLGTGKLMMQD
jgi:hypothetical protein